MAVMWHGCGMTCPVGPEAAACGCDAVVVCLVGLEARAQTALQALRAAPTPVKTLSTSQHPRRRVEDSRLRLDASLARRRRWQARTVQLCHVDITRCPTPAEAVCYAVLHLNTVDNCVILVTDGHDIYCYCIDAGVA